jgi:hypothetical protein
VPGQHAAGADELAVQRRVDPFEEHQVEHDPRGLCLAVPATHPLARLADALRAAVIDVGTPA